MGLYSPYIFYILADNYVDCIDMPHAHIKVACNLCLFFPRILRQTISANLAFVGAGEEGVVGSWAQEGVEQPAMPVHINFEWPFFF